METPKNIIILGAGFGGLKATMTLSKRSRWLSKAGYKVILVDKNDYHTYTPTLYEIATTSKETANYIDLKSVSTFPLKQILANQNISLHQGEVESINIQTSNIFFKAGDSLEYSYLIIALGAEINYFNIPGLEDKALTLKTFHDALDLRETIFANACDASHEQEVEVIIGGGGSTGVELASELQEWFLELKNEGIQCKLSTTLINGTPNILPGLDKKVVRKAQSRLKKLGTKILNKSLIEQVKKSHIILKGGIRVRFDNLIWAGGIKINSLLEQTDLKVDSKEGIEVDKTLQVITSKSNQKPEGKVYAIGDAANFKNPLTGKSIPKLAKPAISQGRVAALNIIKDIKGKKPEEFKSRNEYPYVIPVGGKYAITKIGPLVISGILGWILKGLIELSYIASIIPIPRALSIWLKGLRIFIQNDRLG